MPTRCSVVKVLSTLVLCHPLAYSPPLHAHSCPLLHLASSLCEEEIEESDEAKTACAHTLLARI